MATAVDPRPAIGARRPAALLDKDGTVIEDVPYNVEPDRIRLAPGAAEGLGRLRDAGFALVIVTNQSGVARGLFPPGAIAAVEARLRALMAAAGLPLDGFFWCPHHPDGSVPAFSVRCDCRKPAPGLILRAAESLSLDLPRSWMIGDKLDDVEAGRRAGCRTALLSPDPIGPPGTLDASRTPHLVAPDLAEAVWRIIGR